MKVEDVQAHVAKIDVNMLEIELRAVVSGEVRFDNGSRATYSTDGSNYRQIPIGVVLPKTREDIINTVAICNKYKAPVLSRGGGTSLAGQCCNIAVVMDMTKYFNSILSVDKEKMEAKVESGIVLDELRKVTEKEGITFGPDPATHNHCALGGMLGNNSCGTHSIMAQNAGRGSRTSDNTERLTVLTYDGLVLDVGPTTEEELEQIISEGGRKGDIYKRLKGIRDKYADLIRARFPNIPRRVSGYNIDELLPENGFNVARALVGTEGTCVTILDATLNLIPRPKYRALLVLGYPTIYEAGKHSSHIREMKPIAIEAIDDKLIIFMHKKGLRVDDLTLLPPGKGWLLVEFDGHSQQEADNKAVEVMKRLEAEGDCPQMQLFYDLGQAQKIWEIRKAGLGATAFVPGMADTWEGWEDAAVHPDHVGPYLEDFYKLMDKYQYDGALYGHFGDGCMHTRINFDFSSEEGLEKYRNFTVEATELVLKYGGSLSGEHGDGQSRADLLEMMFGEELMQAFREFKEIWDPEWKMNPGKVIDPYGQTSNLRLGPDYNPPKLKTHFSFPEDGGSFAHATIRCVGVGECRKHEGGTMCPSFMATREEQHSTRGRSRLLFEMLEGDVITKGWKSEEVKEALDLCLACKGCKSDCPVNVDMATYKAEFLSHYYEGKMRPRSAYAFGWIYWWTRLASLAPEVANFFTSNPFTAKIAKKMAGVTQKRDIPQFAKFNFRDWFYKQPRKNINKTQVILWADTFNNYFKPDTLVAAKDVLEAAGFKVIVPKQILCCGRPLYDFGMLDTAKRLLKDILSSLKEEIKQGIPIVGLEPSCVAVFRDEMTSLLPDRDDAKRLRNQVFTISEFLVKYAPDFKVPQLNKKAIVHTHCHHKAIMKTEADSKTLDKTGLDYEHLKTGCCGMAGYFGYEEGAHYDVGLAVGEQVLLPSVREAAKETLVITDGFSCREQIEQGTDREALHTAQVLQMALKQQGHNKNEAYPEKPYTVKPHIPRGTLKRYALLGGITLAVAATVTAIIKLRK
ncbi:FAD-binding and (Fe-S)-binding domain-containing protein [Mucilaginibacter aquatilis]|uniref:FAD-binding protein n=1 Tax=Mucilaginibacter aquatilis TaxID=1517760 RepID=A0A6I4ICR5_9SPHI|nr:FAD-binding and (Fe-S)-binding domain-containing protein [Mucilaginibacter aquatilis]MVN93090.1 FAD-binding protein [Mucilaginibacter aquatilis]